MYTNSSTVSYMAVYSLLLEKHSMAWVLGDNDGTLHMQLQWPWQMHTLYCFQKQYIYIYISLFTYIHIYIYLNVCIYIHVYRYLYIYIHMNVSFHCGISCRRSRMQEKDWTTLPQTGHLIPWSFQAMQNYWNKLSQEKSCICGR